MPTDDDLRVVRDPDEVREFHKHNGSLAIFERALAKAINEYPQLGITECHTTTEWAFSLYTPTDERKVDIAVILFDRSEFALETARLEIALAAGLAGAPPPELINISPSQN